MVFSVVAAFMLFATTIAGAACDPATGFCFEINGYKVEIADPSGVPIPAGGNFPVIVGGNSVFTYKITRTTATNSISHVDILIPVCSPSLGSPTTSCSPACKSASQLYPAGTGDPSTGFGLGLTTDNVLKWYTSCTNTGTVSLTLPGNVSASPNAMLLKIGSSSNLFAYGNILAPSCGSTCGSNFSPSVPLSRTKVMSFSGIDICLEIPDESSCPTAVYSCCSTALDSNGQCMSSYSSSPCGCASANRQLFTEENFGGINLGHLHQVWTISDSRCPISLLSMESIPCKKSVTVNGIPKTYTYYTSPPCTP